MLLSTSYHVHLDRQFCLSVARWRSHCRRKLLALALLIFRLELTVIIAADSLLAYFHAELSSVL